MEELANKELNFTLHSSSFTLPISIARVVRGRGKVSSRKNLPDRSRDRVGGGLVGGRGDA